MVHRQEEHGLYPKWPHWETAQVFKVTDMGTSLVVQWLRLHVTNAGGPGSIPGTRSRMPQLKDPTCRN